MRKIFFLALFPLVIQSFAESQSLIVKDRMWKADADGSTTTINVCMKTQNSSIEVDLMIDALDKSWSYYSNVNFNFAKVRKANGDPYPCDDNFPGVVVTLADERPHSAYGVAYKDAPSSEGDLWPGKKMPMAVKMTLNHTLIAFPPSAKGQATNNLSPSDKDLYFKYSVVHEFGHAIGFYHEHLLPTAVANDATGLDNVCIQHIQDQEKLSGDVVGKSPINSRMLGSYSRLSIMHYSCPDDAGIEATGVYDVQTTLGPTDIATARYLFGVRHPDDLPKAVWGNETKTDGGLEEITFSGTENPKDLAFKLGGNPGGGEFNAKYYTKAKNMDANIIPKTESPQPNSSKYGFYLSGRFTADGYPIFDAVVQNGSFSVPIEVRMTEQSGKVANVDYPGYIITLKSLDSRYPSVTLTPYYSYKCKFTTPSLKDIVVFKDVTGGLLHQANPQSFIRTYSGNATNRFTPQPNGYNFWIPKGYGSFDPATKEFYSDLSEKPATGNWILMPSGKFRINTNYIHASFGIAVGNDEDYGITDINPTLELALPYVPSANVSYMSSLNPSVRSMKFIPSGFDARTKTQIRPFWMSEAEVSLVDYHFTMGTRPNLPPFIPYAPVNRITMYDAVLYCNRRSELENLPPVYSWTSASYDADGNCTILNGLTADKKRIGYRLPTIGEWNHAYRANTTTTYFWGNSLADADKNGWTQENSGNAIHPVALKNPSSWGLYDMLGNVSEWTYDALKDAHGNPAPDYQCAQGLEYAHPAKSATGDPAGSYWFFTCGSAGSKWPFIGFRTVRTFVNLTPITGILLQ